MAIIRHLLYLPYLGSGHHEIRQYFDTIPIFWWLCWTDVDYFKTAPSGSEWACGQLYGTWTCLCLISTGGCIASWSPQHFRSTACHLIWSFELSCQDCTRLDLPVQWGKWKLTIFILLIWITWIIILNLHVYHFSDNWIRDIQQRLFCLSILFTLF